MDLDLAKNALARSKAIQNDASALWAPPSEGLAAESDMVLLSSITKNTRGYVEKIANQVNGTYENGWYDACSVMVRRLVETLIIEVFEHHRVDDQIKNANGDFLYLNDLISRALSCKSWNLSRNTKKSLPKLKDIGDKSAHSRRFIAHRGDIERIIPDLRVVVQELIFIADLK